MEYNRFQNPIGKSIKRILAVWMSFLLLTACAEVPITHRRSLQLLPESELTALSLQEYDQVLKKSKLSTDQQKVEMVRRVGSKIAGSAEVFLIEAGLKSQIKNLNWEFNLIDDDKTVNAWVMPGGKAAVYTGILKYTRDETGLAVVLGHEVGHAIAGHGNERMSQGLLAQMGGIALAVALSENSTATRNLFMQAYGAGTTVGVLLPYSRLQESEADRIGLTLMAGGLRSPRSHPVLGKNEPAGRKASAGVFVHPSGTGVTHCQY